MRGFWPPCRMQTWSEVVDIKPDRAEVAAQYGTTPYSNASELVGRVDAVSIATPTVSHVAVALPFVESGAAVLVEKPLAATVEDADRLLAAADARGTVLAVGHGAFNPAVAAALPLVSRPSSSRFTGWERSRSAASISTSYST